MHAVAKNFADVKASTLQSQLSTAKSKGSGLQTLSVYLVGNNVMTAGAFDSRVATPWDIRIGLSSADMLSLWNGVLTPGFAPRELSVIVTNGAPSFSVLLRAYSPSNPNTNFIWDLTTPDFNDYLRVATLNKFRITDYATYMVGGIRKSAAVLVKDAGVSTLYSDFTLVGINSRVAEMAKQGWYVTSLNVSNTGAALADNYSVVFTQQAEPTYALFDLSKAQLNTQLQHFKTLGLFLVKVQVLSNRAKFAAIFAKTLTK